MNNVYINSKKYEINDEEKNYLIYQYCTERNIELPCFCYNEKLEIAGNCRICLVEIEKMAKLMLACSTKIENGMSIKTNTLRVRKVRKSIIEFLLINHPLDCPVCDQAGECDLQDITHKFGLQKGRFYEYSKRAVIDKQSHLFIKTILTRCIHCTRCIRFFKEIEGQTGFGFLNRGENTEIVLNKAKLLSILSGNVVDICPVGALTSKVYSFRARPWENVRYETIDILDSMCSPISLDIRNNRILRILPVSDTYWNSDWITNIARYFFDSLYVQRLEYPYLNFRGKELIINWVLVIKIFLKNLLENLINNKGLLFMINQFMDLESCVLLKQLNIKLGYYNIAMQKNIYNNFDKHCYFFFNSDFNNLKFYNNFFFLGLNLRLQLPLINSLLRQLLKKKYIQIYSIGNMVFDISFPMINLGNNLSFFFLLLEYKSKYNLSMFYSSFFLSNFKNFSKSIIKQKVLLIGENFYFYKNTYKLVSKFMQIFNYGFNTVYSFFFKIGNLHYQELNFKNNVSIKEGFFFNTAFDYKYKKKKGVFSVMQTTNHNNLLKNYNLVLPTTSFFEYDGWFLNLTGRLKRKLKMYQYNEKKLKSPAEILQFIYLNLFVLDLNWNFYYKYFNKLLCLNFNNLFNLYYSKIIFVDLKNKLYQYNYTLTFKNIIFFDNLINVYKVNSLYKFSLVLQQAYYNLQNYISVCNYN